MGGRYGIDLGGDSNDEKKTKISYTLALDGCRSIIITQQPTKKGPEWHRGIARGGATIGERGGGCKSIVLVAIGGEDIKN